MHFSMIYRKVTRWVILKGCKIFLELLFCASRFFFGVWTTPVLTIKWLSNYRTTRFLINFGTSPAASFLIRANRECTGHVSNCYSVYVYSIITWKKKLHSFCISHAIITALVSHNSFTQNLVSVHDEHVEWKYCSKWWNYLENVITNAFLQMSERYTGERERTNVSALFFCIGFVVILVSCLVFKRPLLI